MWEKLKWVLALWAGWILASKAYPAEVWAVMNTVSTWINSALTAVTPYAASAAPFVWTAAAAAVPWYFVWKKWGKIAWVWAWVAWLGFLTWWAILPGLSAYGLTWMAWWIANTEWWKITWVAATALTYWVLASNPAFMLWGLWLYWANKLLVPWIKAWAQKMQNAASWTYAKTLWRFRSNTWTTATP